MPVNSKSGIEGDWRITLCQVPYTEPFWFCAGVFFPICTAGYQRQELLSLTGEPYLCCAGLVPCGPLMTPMSEEFLWCEACCCPPCAIQGNRYFIQTRFNKGNTCADDLVVALACACSLCSAVNASVGFCDVPDAFGHVCDFALCCLMACMLGQQQDALNEAKKHKTKMPDHIFSALPKFQQQAIRSARKPAQQVMDEDEAEARRKVNDQALHRKSAPPTPEVMSSSQPKRHSGGPQQEASGLDGRWRSTNGANLDIAGEEVRFTTGGVGQLLRNRNGDLNFVYGGQTFRPVVSRDERQLSWPNGEVWNLIAGPVAPPAGRALDPRNDPRGEAAEVVPVKPRFGGAARDLTGVAVVGLSPRGIGLETCASDSAEGCVSEVGVIPANTAGRARAVMVKQSSFSPSRKGGRASREERRGEERRGEERRGEERRAGSAPAQQGPSGHGGRYAPPQQERRGEERRGEERRGEERRAGSAPAQQGPPGHGGRYGPPQQEVRLTREGREQSHAPRATHREHERLEDAVKSRAVGDQRRSVK